MSYLYMIQLKSDIPHTRLTKLLTRLVERTVENGGIVRRIRNNGVRPMAYRMHARGHDGQRYYDKVRMVTFEVFCPPTTLRHIAKPLGMEDLDMDVLRFNVTRADDTLPVIRNEKGEEVDDPEDYELE